MRGIVRRCSTQAHKVIVQQAHFLGRATTMAATTLLSSVSGYKGPKWAFRSQYMFGREVPKLTPTYNPTHSPLNTPT